MKLQDIINKIEQNQTKISSFGKFDDAVLKKINYKIRLDWNYYSNRMEGGTLTREETRSVMVGNIEVKGKPFKDVAEMTGHNKVVLDVLKMSKGEIRISEKRMYEIHKAIMHEDDPEIIKQIGKWKTIPNEIINYKNEKNVFTPPSEVAEEVHKLLDRTNAQLDKYFAKKESKHPLEIAAQFHIDYINIHPFYDGNGRTARIFLNILLMACGYPAIIIKEDLKRPYYQLLADIQSYGGKADLFYAFIGERILETQKLVLDALEGKEIEEPGDLDKKIMLLERELETIDPNEEVKVRLNADYMEEVLHSWVSDLVKKVVPEIQKFNKFFTGTNHNLSIQNVGSYVQFINEPADEILEKLISGFVTNKDRFQTHNTEFRLHTFYGTLIKGGLKTFGCNYGIDIKFDYIKYELFVDEFSEDGQNKKVKLVERLLHKPLTVADINDVATKLTNAIYEHIDFNTKKNGLR